MPVPPLHHKNRCIGQRVNRRQHGAKGCYQRGSKTSLDQNLSDCVSRVADKIDVMADAVVNRQQSNIITIVREEVQNALGPTLTAVNEIKELLK